MTSLWTAETRTGPLRFQAGCRKRRLNLALGFCVYFVLQYMCFDWWMCAFVVLGFVFPCQAIDWLRERLRNDLFCVEWDVKPQLSESSAGGDADTWVDLWTTAVAEIESCKLTFTVNSGLISLSGSLACLIFAPIFTTFERHLLDRW